MRSIDGRQFGHVGLLGFVVVAVVGVDVVAFLAVVGKGVEVMDSKKRIPSILANIRQSAHATASSRCKC